jgi:(2R)-3-sulfolactate dehydrogenase (NADP+)
MTHKVSLQELQRLAEGALRRAGANREHAASIATSLVDAEAEGKKGVGLAHLADYCAGLSEGRIDGSSEPKIDRPVPAVFRSDAQGGPAHTAFDRIFVDFCDVAHQMGIAVFIQKNAYTCGALGYFARRLAERRLLAFIAANGGPAVMVASGTTQPVFCTNPFAFAVPRLGGPPLVIDQSTSATAIVNLRRAAEVGQPIPQGWALDENGASTTDPSKALKGVLLAFGGARGANVALMVEILAAGISGANWSIDAPSFNVGETTPGVGMFVLALSGDLLLGGDFAGRMGRYLARLEQDHHAYLPGRTRVHQAAEAGRDGVVVEPAVAKLFAD